MADMQTLALTSGTEKDWPIVRALTGHHERTVGALEGRQAAATRELIGAPGLTS